MCGIAGIYTPGRPVEEGALHAMLSRLQHRGPDDEGAHFSPGLAMGARRLSIIDIAGGHQPMEAGEGITVSQNGEIYNFPELREELERAGERFRTRSDTEVIGRLYRARGPQGFTRLSGMFAAAVFDARSGELALARDRSGIKPLYVAEIPGGIAYASELSALLASGLVQASPNPEALRSFAMFGFIAGGPSSIHGVERLAPGECLVFGPQGSRRSRFAAAYEPRVGAPAGVPGTPDVLARLSSSVERHMLSDVPVGVFLSGGLDSSAIVATLAGRGVRVRTFSIGPEGGAHLDERPLARRVADRFHMEHHSVALATPNEASMRELARAFDEPFADSSAFATLQLSRLARQFVTVALSGTGGDETLSGYERYGLPAMLRRARVLPPHLAGQLSRGIDRLRPNRRSAQGELMLRAQKLLSARSRRRPAHGYVESVAVSRNLWGPLFHGTRAEGEELVERLLEEVGLAGRPFDSAFGPAFDHRMYLPDDLLVKEDRASMAVSLESRVPFLDVDWLRWTEQIGEGRKRPGGRPKGILRDAMADLLPPSITARPKHGFAMPVSGWMRSESMRWVEDLFQPGGVETGLDLREARSRFLDHRAGRLEAGEELWAAAMIQLWASEHVAQASPGLAPEISAMPLPPGPPAPFRVAPARASRVRVVRIISRMNVGGPAIHVSLLTSGLQEFGFDTMLVRGQEGPHEGSMDDVARRYRVTPVSVPGLRREMQPMDDARALMSLVELLRRERPDIVHTHTSKAGMLGRIAAARVGVPIVLHTFHGHVLDGYFNPIMVRGIMAVERQLARRSTRLIAVSQATLEDMVGIGIPREKLVHIPLGLPIDDLFQVERGRGNFRASIGVPTGVPLIGILARLAEVKRHEIFLKAAALLKMRDPYMHFAVVGGGDREWELRRQAVRLGLGQSVHFTGFRRDLGEVLSDLDVSVLCSRSEGLPVALIESMAASLPVVASEVGGVRELLGNDEAGLLVRSEDPEGLASSVYRLLKDRDLRARLTAAGRLRAERYRERRLLVDMASLYHELLGSRTPPRSM